MQQCARERKQILHDRARVERINIDRTKRDACRFERRHNFTQMSAITHENGNNSIGLFAARCCNDLYHASCFFNLGVVCRAHSVLLCRRCRLLQPIRMKRYRVPINSTIRCDVVCSERHTRRVGNRPGRGIFTRGHQRIKYVVYPIDDAGA